MILATQLTHPEDVSKVKSKDPTSTAFMVTPKMIVNTLTFCFLIKYKTRNIIMKTEQTTIVYAQWDRWTSYDVIKHHMITTDVTIK